MEMDGKALPTKLYYPTIVTISWFRTWGLRCGRCDKDFHRFAFFGKPRCPYCGVKNSPQLVYWN
jgi:rRNA maturation endonuclease Nob1